jgi:hypothetical protein
MISERNEHTLSIVITRWKTAAKEEQSESLTFLPNRVFAQNKTNFSPSRSIHKKFHPRLLAA